MIICAHNAATRIVPTLQHLARQKGVTVPWEVILVDNGSTDGTAEVAQREWPSHAPAPLRLFTEEKLGYNHAAECGLRHARYGIIAQVHDDNWLAEDWLARIPAIFARDREIGACGGQTTAAFESAPPEWFRRFQAEYAVGQQAEESGDVTWSRGFLWGAGLCIRRSAWLELKQNGFQPLSPGRQGRGRLISGEDSEICFALRLAGWKLWYEEALRLTHYLPAARLEWRYLRRLFRSFGESSVAHDCFRSPVSADYACGARTWHEAVFKSLGRLRQMRRTWPALFRRWKGNPDVLQLELLLGRIAALLRMRDLYNETHRSVRDAGWRKLERMPHATRPAEKSI